MITSGPERLDPRVHSSWSERVDKWQFRWCFTMISRVGATVLTTVGGWGLWQNRSLLGLYPTVEDRQRLNKVV